MIYLEELVDVILAEEGQVLMGIDFILDDLKLSREVADEIMQEIISNPTKIIQVKIEKPKKPKKYKMTEMEVLQMIFGNKDMLESIKKL